MRVTDTLIKELRSALPGLELHENEPMSAHCSFRIGGPARLMALPRTEEAVERALAGAAFTDCACQKPASAALMTTNRCNMGCPVCFTRDKKEGLHEPDLAECERLLRLYRETAGEDAAIEFCGGEPTVREDIFELAALAREPFVFFDPHVGTGLYDDILGLLRRYGHTPVIAQEVGEAMTIIGLVAAGLGVSILPASFQRVQLSEMRWLPIDEQDAVSEMWLVWSKHHEQGALAKRFRDTLLAWKSERN